MGEVRLTTGPGSTLCDLRQSGALKVLFPDGDGPGLTGILLNTAGGVTGGDRLRLSAVAGTGGRLTLTTQAAERIYAARPGETAIVTTDLTIAAGARLDWLPQETILFDRAALRRGLSVAMAADATLLLVEPLVLGRPAMAETVRDARVSDVLRIRRDGALIYADRLALNGDLAATFSRRAVANGAGAAAQIVYAAPDAARHLAPLRGLLPSTAGASLAADGLLIARLLAPDAFDLRQALIPVLTLLRGDALPRSWML